MGLDGLVNRLSTWVDSTKSRVFNALSKRPLLGATLLAIPTGLAFGTYSHFLAPMAQWSKEFVRNYSLMATLGSGYIYWTNLEGQKFANDLGFDIEKNEPTFVRNQVKSFTGSIRRMYDFVWENHFVLPLMYVGGITARALGKIHHSPQDFLNTIDKKEVTIDYAINMMGVNFFTYSLVGILGYSALAQVMHSQNFLGNLQMFKSMFIEQSKGKQEAIDYLEDIGPEQREYHLGRLARLYSQTGDLGKAFLCMQETLSDLEHSKHFKPSKLFSRWINRCAISHYARQYLKEKNSVSISYMAMVSQVFSRKDLALDYWQEFLQQDPKELGHLLLYAEGLLDIGNEERAMESYREVIEQIRSSGDLMNLRSYFGDHRVFTFEVDSILKNGFAVKVGTEETLRGHEEVFRDHQGFFYDGQFRTAKSIVIVPFDEDYYHFIRRAKGEVVGQVIQDPENRFVHQDMLAFAGRELAVMPIRGQRRLNPFEYLSKILKKSNFSHLSPEIMAAYSDFSIGMDEYPDRAALDCHAYNYHAEKDKRRYERIDLEPRGGDKPWYECAKACFLELCYRTNARDFRELDESIELDFMAEYNDWSNDNSALSPLESGRFHFNVYRANLDKMLSFWVFTQNKPQNHEIAKRWAKNTPFILRYGNETFGNYGTDKTRFAMDKMADIMERMPIDS